MNHLSPTTARPDDVVRARSTSEETAVLDPADAEVPIGAATQDPPFQTMDDVRTAAGEIVERMWASDPEALRGWL